MSPKTSFVLGGARSGTTWLAKIIDSHPDVIYRHEPDIPYPDEILPVFCNADDVENHIPLAVKRVEGYLQTRHIRATGVQPIFPKSYLSPFQFNMRKFAIYFLRFIERFDNLRELSYKLSVPDFIDIGSDSNLCLIKTVNALGHVLSLIHI